MKYLTIKNTRALLIRYVMFIFLLWLALVILKNGDTINIILPGTSFSVNFLVVRPHVVGIAILLLATFIMAHALAYRLSRWMNNGKRGWAAALKALFISWSLITLIFLFVVSEFSVNSYVLVVSLFPLVLAPLLSWELRRASRV